MMKQKIEKTADEKMWNRISQIPAVILVLLSGIDIVRFAILGDKTAFITFSMIAVTFMLVAYMAWKSRMPFLYLVIAAAAFVLYFNTNFSTSTYYFNWLFLVESIIEMCIRDSGRCENIVDKAHLIFILEYVLERV